MDIYSELERLKKLLDDGVVTQEEFEREKARLLSMNYEVQPAGWNLGIDEKSFVVLMHASQFLSSFIAPLIMWLMFKDKSRTVDEAGKNILNFQISIVVYSLILLLTCIGIALLPFIGIAAIILIIIAIIKALNGETWRYPLTVRFIK